MPLDPASRSLKAYRKLRAYRPELFCNNDAVRIVTENHEIAEALKVESQWKLNFRDAEPLQYGVMLEDPYLGLIVRDPVQFNGKDFGLYNRHIAKTGCLILPIFDTGIVLLRIFRHSLRDWSWELPGGLVADGVEAEAAARMELQEEIGATALDIFSLGTIHPYTPLSNCNIHLFAAHIAGIGIVQADEGIVEARRIPRRVLGEMIASGEVSDASTLSCILKAQIAGLI